MEELISFLCQLDEKYDLFNALKAAVGLVVSLGIALWQFRQKEKHHKEDIAELRLQHNEMLESQNKNQQKELEIKRMGTVNSEHPLIQTSACSVHLFPIDTRSEKISYGLIWQFKRGDNFILRNPVFCCTITDKSTKILGRGFCRHGQLPLSESGKYEVVFRLENIDLVTVDSECTMKVLFQNSLGGYFMYSESCRLGPQPPPVKPIHDVLFDKARYDLVMISRSALVTLLKSGNIGLTFLRTEKPIIDVPLTETDFKEEMRQFESSSQCDDQNICQSIMDENASKKYLQDH